MDCTKSRVFDTIVNFRIRKGTKYKNLVSEMYDHDSNNGFDTG